MLTRKSQLLKLCANLETINKILHSSSYLLQQSKAKATCYGSVSVPRPKVDTLFKGLVAGDRASLAHSITLVESVHPQKRLEARELLTKVLDYNHRLNLHTPQSFRIGLTGPPGAGKSTFIETIGQLLIKKKHKLAVLTVDPSSKSTGGSLLGDKTRMPELSANMKAYIRPSLNSCTLGGVTRSTNEAICLAECSGFDLILVETVGVGQSEVSVSDMVDMFVLIIPPAGGDELQGIKKGVIELADIIVVNKSDGDLIPAARKISAEYISALKFVRPRNFSWKPCVKRISSKTGEGIDDLWTVMQDYGKSMIASGELEKRRRQQLKVWMWNQVNSSLLDLFYQKVGQGLAVEYEKKVTIGQLTAGDAADELIEIYLKSIG